MKNLTVDVAVIGAGTAGLAAYRAARARGARAVIVEAGPYGTTCARVGCMPSKLLIAAAAASHAIGDAPGFVIHVEGAMRVDGREVMARVRRERDRFVGLVMEGVERIPAADRVAGKARLADRNTVEVDGHTRIRARAIVVATVSRPAIPPMLLGAGDRLVVNDDVFSWDTLPRSVAVFGPGVIGLELGQALARLGVRVVVLRRGGGAGPRTDPLVGEGFLKAMSAELYVDPDAHVKRVARITDGVEVEYTRLDGAVRTESFDYVLAATGRRPNVDGLGLESPGLELDATGVPRFYPATMRVGETNLFIKKILRHHPKKRHRTINCIPKEGAGNSKKT